MRDVVRCPSRRICCCLCALLSVECVPPTPVSVDGLERDHRERRCQDVYSGPCLSAVLEPDLGVLCGSV